VSGWSLWSKRKILQSRESNRAFQPVARRYTDWATSSPGVKTVNIVFFHSKDDYKFGKDLCVTFVGNMKQFNYAGFEELTVVTRP
jgi:hypothetical protein